MSSPSCSQNGSHQRPPHRISDALRFLPLVNLWTSCRTTRYSSGPAHSCRPGFRTSSARPELWAEPLPVTPSSTLLTVCLLAFPCAFLRTAWPDFRAVYPSSSFIVHRVPTISTFCLFVKRIFSRTIVILSRPGSAMAEQGICCQGHGALPELSHDHSRRALLRSHAFR